MAKVLVLQSASVISGVLSEMLESLQHNVVATQSVDQALQLIAQGGIDTAVIDVNDCSSAVSCLTEMKNDSQAMTTPVIVATAIATTDQVIETMRLGAFDHINKPIHKDELTAVLARALARPKHQDMPAQQQAQTGDLLIGLSPAMRNTAKQIGIASACQAAVIVQGETGTGKGTVARAIHRHSRQANQPLSVIDCTALAEDYDSFQSLSPGAQGTVILDEVGDLSPKTQAMLVRALNEAPSDLRIIATSQYDLIKLVEEKRFREDLYYRLYVMAINLPPLRERGSDVIALAEAFLQQANPDNKMRLTSSACKAMLDYVWPGNVRELQNVMYHVSAAVRTAEIEEKDLPFFARLADRDIEKAEGEKQEESLDYHKAVNDLEKRLLNRALQEANGSRAEAARLLGINRQLLYSKLKSHKMSD